MEEMEMKIGKQSKGSIGDKNGGNSIRGSHACSCSWIWDNFLVFVWMVLLLPLLAKLHYK